MGLFDMTDGTLVPVDQTSFAAEHVLERAHLQAAIRENIALLGDDLLVSGYLNPFVPACDLGLYPYHGKDEITEYRRSLNLDEAVAEVSYVAGGVRYRRGDVNAWRASRQRTGAEPR